ncbi:DUF932 domain-containing protein, partial [Candidatus Thorarchaeota archaeon]
MSFNGNGLMELATELERQKESRLDVVVDSRNITAMPDQEGTVKLSIPTISDNVNYYTVYPMTDFAHSQVAAKTNIPKRYYDKMREGHPDLLALNINEWMPSKDRRLIRVLDGKVRAFLSDRYKILDNHDLLFQALGTFKDVGADIHKADLSPTNMYVKAIVPHTIEEIRAGDQVIPGVILRNSEVGDGAFRVDPFMLRLVCSNGMIGMRTLKRVHLGAQKEIGTIDWSDETKSAVDKGIWLQVRDTIRQTFDPEVFAKWVDQLRQGTEVEIENPSLAIDNVIENYSINQDMKTDLLNQFLKGGDSTQWGLANAVTAAAKYVESVDVQV